MITPHTHSSIQLRAYVMEAPPLGVVPLYTGDLCPSSVYVRVSGRVCICKLYIHLRVCTCTQTTRYLCVSIPRRGRTRALTMPLADSVADIGWLMEKFSPQRKLWYTLVSPVPPRRSPSVIVAGRLLYLESIWCGSRQHGRQSPGVRLLQPARANLKLCRLYRMRDRILVAIPCSNRIGLPCGSRSFHVRVSHRLACVSVIGIRGGIKASLRDSRLTMISDEE